MKYCTNKDIDKLVKRLVREGWYFRRGAKHGRLITPTGTQALTVACSSSDCRSFNNFRGDVRRAVKSSTLRLDQEKNT